MSDDASSIENGVENHPAADATAVVGLVGGNVRRLRVRAGLSLRELANRAAVSTSTLSGLEAGTGNPGVETLVTISRALGVPFSELVLPHEPDVRVQRAGEGVVVEAADAHFSSRLLVADSGRSVTEVYEAAMAPGVRYQAEPHLPGVTESVIVVDGRMRVGPVDAPVDLGPGDRASFAADQDHSYEALAPGTRMILVLSYR
ncbi:MAG TPA: XRE family transcriptional regulator [Acidimicrobiales bacterium]|nr:XRE family transcriptional regulator [Acidimicrobiales bacterium]